MISSLLSDGTERLTVAAVTCAGIPVLVLLAHARWRRVLRPELPHWRNGLGLASTVIISVLWLFALKTDKFDPRPYYLEAGDFNIALSTPPRSITGRRRIGGCKPSAPIKNAIGKTSSPPTRKVPGIRLRRSDGKRRLEHTPQSSQST
jgi:hypothetical protein